MTPQYWIQPTRGKAAGKLNRRCKIAKDTVLRIDQVYRINLSDMISNRHFRGLTDFIFDFNFKEQLHFIIYLNKRVSLALARRTTSFCPDYDTFKLFPCKFLSSDTGNDENGAMRMLCKRF